MKKNPKWTGIDRDKGITSDIPVVRSAFVVAGCNFTGVLTEEEREQVERLRWPSRGYLQELNEYQQRRRKLRKSRCTVM